LCAGPRYPEDDRSKRRYHFEVDYSSGLLGPPTGPNGEERPTAQDWVDAITAEIAKLWNPGERGGASDGGAGAVVSPGGDGGLAAVARPRRGSAPDALPPSPKASDPSNPLASSIVGFNGYLEKFLAAARPAHAVLMADAAAMQSDCDHLVKRFGEGRAGAAASGDAGGGSVDASGGVPGGAEGESQRIFADLCTFASLLSAARGKWEVEHGQARGDDDDDDDDDDDGEEEGDEDPLIERLAHYIKARCFCGAGTHTSDTNRLVLVHFVSSLQSAWYPGVHSGAPWFPAWSSAQVGVTFEQLERDLAVKGVADASRLLRVAGSRAQFALPDDLEATNLARLGIDPDQVKKQHNAKSDGGGG